MAASGLFVASLALGALLFLPSSSANASDALAFVQRPSQSSWTAVISGHSSIPPYLVAVDKSRQQLSFFERRSPLKLSRKFACTTGKKPGDKITQGDLKTPEGIYFVERRINGGLDFIKYGNEAYTLNYPNPVDRLRRKTGYGIWIHGRGEPLVPLQTEGCVSMNNEDLALLGKLLIPGTPVALTESFAYKQDVPRDDDANIKALEQSVRSWAKAWSDRSNNYFDFYDKQAYSLAQGQPFSAFQAQKERLFRSLPWIKTTVRDIQTLAGPGYWVTWFYQDYQAPNLSTKGVRRLYWSKNGKGQFKILGMEWQPGMNTSTTIASAEPLLPPPGPDAPPPVLAAYAEREKQAQAASGAPSSNAPAPVASSTAAGASSASNATQTGQASNGSILVADAQGPSASGSLATDASSGVTTQGAAANLQSNPASDTAASVAEPYVTPIVTLDHVEHASQGVMAQPDRRALDLAKKLQGDSVKKGEPTLLASASQVNEKQRTAAHPAAVLPPPLPSQRLAASSLPENFAERLPSAERDFETSAAKGKAEPQAKSIDKNMSGGNTVALAGTPSTPPAAKEKAPSASTAKDGAKQDAAAGAQATDKNSTPAATGSAAAALEATAAASGQDKGTPAVATVPERTFAQSKAEVEKRIGAWRRAWESGKVDSYIRFYSKNAKQGSRSGASAIRRQKERVWEQAAPQTVALRNIKIREQGKRIVASMRQEYSDTKGNSDLGTKTLTFELHNGVWVITHEDWSALPR